MLSRLQQLSSGRRAAAAVIAPGFRDPALPALARLREIGPARAWCDGVAPFIGVAPGSLEKVVVLRYRPGRRCTLRLDFTDPTRRLYVKLFAGRRSTRAARRLDALGPARRAAIRWPEVVHHQPEDGLFVLSEVPGRPLEEILVSAPSAEHASNIGRGIALLHGRSRSLAGASLKVWRPADERTVVERQAPRLDGPRSRSPALGREALRLARESLETARYSPAMLLHRDLHPQQLLLESATVGFVDLDNLCVGSPEIDVGNLVAHLDLLGLHVATDAGLFRPFGHSLLAAYRSLEPLELSGLHAVRVASLVRLAALYAGARHLTGLSDLLMSHAVQVAARVAA